MNDRFLIYNQNENEVLELAKRLRYPVDAILSAVQEVGFNEDEIEEYIRDREERSLF
jgi:maltoporin